MSEPFRSLGEPNEALKHDFRSIIEQNIPADEPFRIIPLADGRELTLLRPHERAEVDVYTAGFTELVTVEGSEPVRHCTQYDVQLDGTVRKMFMVLEEQSDPDRRSILNQAMQAEEVLRSALEAIGEDTTGTILEALSPELQSAHEQFGIDPLASLLDDLATDREEEKHGFGNVSGIELQSVVEEIRSATGGSTS